MEMERKRANRGREEAKKETNVDVEKSARNDRLRVKENCAADAGRDKGRRGDPGQCGAAANVTRSSALPVGVETQGSVPDSKQTREYQVDERMGPEGKTGKGKGRYEREWGRKRRKPRGQ